VKIPELKPQDVGRIHLSHKVALVNGASRGIGEAIARGLAACGARLVLSSRDQATAQARSTAAVSERRAPAQSPSRISASVRAPNAANWSISASMSCTRAMSSVDMALCACWERVAR